MNDEREEIIARLISTPTGPEDKRSAAERAADILDQIIDRDLTDIAKRNKALAESTRQTMLEIGRGDPGFLSLANAATRQLGQIDAIAERILRQGSVDFRQDLRLPNRNQPNPPDKETPK